MQSSSQGKRGDSSSGPTISCPHFKLLPWSQMDSTKRDEQLFARLKTKIETDKQCKACSKQPKSLFICLNPDCLFLGCGRDDKKHALEHFKNRHNPSDRSYHGLVLNTQAFQCWCYECDDGFTPTIFAALEPNDDTPRLPNGTVSSLKKKGSMTTAAAVPPNAVGLCNLGNSCYMNAAIQSLLNCPSFMGFFLRCGAFIYRHPHRRISESFHKLISMILTTAISPSRLVREVKVINPMFHGYTQQDTMDFVRCIFERIHEEMKTSCSTHGPLSNDVLDSGHRRRSERLARLDKMGASPIKGSKESPPKYHSIISDSFGGTLRSEIHCLNCNNISVKDDPYFDVCVQICATADGAKSAKSSFGYIGNLFTSFGESIGINAKPVKLETCLAAFCAAETLDGKDRYRCEKCKQLVDSKKALRFKELPQVLCIQLKRFKHESYFSSKIGTHVIFPIDNLDMRPFLHESASEKSKKETRYYLSSVINHRGTFSGGHYVSYCRHQESGQWLEFDDVQVNPVSEEDVSKVQAYTLFYSLVDWNMRRERDDWLPRINQASIPKGVYVSKAWFNKWCTLADPGPLDNTDVVCKHGHLVPDKHVDPTELVQLVPAEAYKYFEATYGESAGLDPLQSATPCVKCIQEEEELEARRKREERDIQALDTSTIKPDELWYLISSEWLILWGQFKSGSGPPPGPISNDHLMLSSTQPRANLVRGTHYRGVNRRVWDYFHRIYGGGPMIVRKSINIYSAPPASSHQDIDSQTDDVYVDVVGH